MPAEVQSSICKQCPSSKFFSVWKASITQITGRRSNHNFYAFFTVNLALLIKVQAKVILQLAPIRTDASYTSRIVFISGKILSRYHNYAFGCIPIYCESPSMLTGDITSRQPKGMKTKPLIYA